MADIKIDGKLFQERINHFINAWKADKRAGDTVFSGVSSILIMMGKVEENPEFQKNNAMHVCNIRNVHVPMNRAIFCLKRLTFV